ncbi:NRPS-like enzyme [Lasiodiplodia theobromae]|uniref:NRPS-like enzyme n=1 Tax=Lasiodiplodia theobromae TaxID=45133 RepID=UPI0015C32B90|nr:NRPS-like enzyme [Lasiodiplodia theobromae]KAF4534220.1 NRPS-like enzyme [Lasiodiplodia theobromae]
MGTLINTEKLRVLYNEAESNRHEAYPTRFFNFFLQKIAFPEEEYWISSEQPPTDDPSDRKRVDLVVNYFSQDYKVRVLCFTELKRGRSAEKAIEENEDQAIETRELQQEVYSDGTALIKPHGIALHLRKGEHFSLDSIYYEWTGARMYRHETPRPDVWYLIYSQGRYSGTLQFNQGQWWKQVDGEWVRA